MRWFTAVLSVLFLAIGFQMIAEDERIGSVVVVFFVLFFLVMMFAPDFERYHLVITEDEIACEYSWWKRETIRWDDVDWIRYVTKDAGSRVPDEWFVLENVCGECSFPSEATGLDLFWDEVDRRFPGFNYEPITAGTAGSADHICWRRKGAFTPASEVSPPAPEEA